MSRTALLTVSFAVLSVPLQAFADDANHELAATAESSNRVAITGSLFRLLSPMAELGLEIRQNEKMAWSATLGVGTQDVDTRQTDGDFAARRVLCVVAGAQFRYYLFGKFDRGFFVGGELWYAYNERDRDNSIRPLNDGMYLGPSIGYKHTFGFGMVVGASITGGVPIYKPDGLTEDEVPGDVDVQDWPVVPWPNAVVGWAF